MKSREPNLPYSLRLPARMASLEGFAEFVRKSSEKLEIDSSLTSRFLLVLEELLVNIVHYAYAGAETRGDIEVDCGMADSETFCIAVRDTGKPFNPLLSGEPDLTENMDRRPVGGLGIFLVREIADQLDYRREDDTNVVVFRKKIGPAASA